MMAKSSLNNSLLGGQTGNIFTVLLPVIAFTAYRSRSEPDPTNYAGQTRSEGDCKVGGLTRGWK